ncbi:MAG TPA: 50S ribosomal protein L4 [Candidatus Paceibacterota bacterium]
MEATIYNKEAKEVGKINLPETVFGLPWNADLVHQVITSLQSNQREAIAHTKTRGEVRGGGKKPWRQKGTGRARHGSIRSPLWKGGGTTFGPRNEKSFEKKLNRKVKTKALFTLLSAKMREGNILLVDSLGLDAPKTKNAEAFLTSFSGTAPKINYKKGKRVIIATDGKNEAVWKSFRNLKAAHVEDVRNLSPLDIATYKYIVFADPEKTVKLIEGRKKTSKK